MRAKKIMLVALATVFIAGCKTTVETQVNLTDLLNGQTKVIPSALYVEVASCNDYEDSRKPSSSLLEAQEQIPGVFQDAEYVECFRQKMDSFASFKLPVYLDKDKDGQPASNDHINLASNDSILLAINVPKSIQTKLAAAKEKMMGSSLEMHVSIKIKNDTGKDFTFDAVSVYVDDSPAVYSRMTVHKDKEFLVKLSDVSVQAAITGPGAPVLLRESEAS